MIITSLYFTFMTVIYLSPAIPLSFKGIFGIIFIIISNTKKSLRGSLVTAFYLIILQTINLFLNNNVVGEIGILYAITGTIAYIFAAFYLGLSAEKCELKQRELQREIEARKAAEKELKENLSLLESLLTTLPTPVCFKDLSFRFTSCNAAYEDYFELSALDIKGKKAHDLFEADIADTCLEMDIELLENGTSQARSVSFQAKDGRRKHFIFTKALVSDDKGEAIGIVSVFLDTTDQREHEMLRQSVEEEKRIIDEMQKYDMLKTEFFSNISHELRTPLNVIICAVQLMEMNLNESSGQLRKDFVKKYVISIKQNSLRLLRLVNNLIDITKIDAQSYQINLRNGDIAYALKEIVLSVSDYITNKGLKLVFHSDIEEKIIAYDEEKIERIMLNLLSNAIKFSPLGESIYVDITNQDGYVRIQVRDMGLGIPQDQQQVIFQRFYQISPVNTRLHEGSGIGLNLVKSLVEMHQGRIRVESESGKGTTFIVELPDIMLPEDVQDPQGTKDRCDRIEMIQLEFSDIYMMDDHETHRIMHHN